MFIGLRKNIAVFLLFIHDLVVSVLVLKFSTILKSFLGKYRLFFIKPAFEDYFLEIYWVSLLLVFIFYIKGLYSKQLSFWDETKEIIVSVFYTVVLSFALIYLSKNVLFPRSILFFYFAFIVLALPLSRYYFKVFLAKLGLFRSNVVILGANDTGRLVARALLADKEFGVKILGFLDNHKTGVFKVNGVRYKILGKIDEFSEILPANKADAAVIALPFLDEGDLETLASNVQKFVRKLYLVPKMKRVSTSNAELYHLFDEQMFLLKINNNLGYFRNRFFKNLFDLVLALILTPFLLFLIFIIGILIKLTSEGPVIFSHERIGKNGKKMKVYKFRTMYKDAKERLERILKEDDNAKKEWETYFKLKNDPRVTPIGKFLRKTSLDELPQIFNVLKGEMSFVGPRPVIEDEIKKYYREYASFYCMVKPGITGLWQISGRNDVDYDNRVRLDTWYVLNWSLWLDIVILLKTVLVVLKREGAY